jgi:hypothetical protein
MNAYQFIVKLRDNASSGLRDIARSAGIADNRIDELNRSSASTGNTFGRLRRLAAGAFAGIALTGLTMQIVDARSEYERFDAVLTNTFQSAEKGQASLNMLEDFAAKTPFQLNKLSDAYVKLVNRGFEPTRAELTSLGDLASSQGKGFKQLAEAILDAETNEFERLKEFGIKASKAGDQVTLSFKGVSKTVDANAESIREAIMAYGEMEGVAGAMDAISKTLGGRISNLKDQWWSFMVAIGGESGGVLAWAIDTLSDGIAFLKDHLPEISEWFRILWSHIEPVVNEIEELTRAAFGIDDSTSAIQTFGNIMNGVLMIVDYFTTGLGFLIDLLGPVAPLLAVATGAMWLLNIAMYANPVGLIIAGVIILSTLIGMAIKYTSGWGGTWNALKEFMGTFFDSLITDFKFALETAGFFFESLWLGAKNVAQKIVGKFVNVKEAIKMALAGDISGAWGKLFERVNTQAEDELLKVIGEQKKRTEDWIQSKKENSRKLLEQGVALKDELANMDIKVDTEGVANDFQKLKDTFTGLGEKDTANSFLGGGDKPTADPDTDNPLGTAPGSTIISGGPRHTNINLTIHKLQDDTKIYVSSVEKGLDNLGDKVQEMILRAVNSVNQTQTV